MKTLPPCAKRHSRGFSITAHSAAVVAMAWLVMQPVPGLPQEVLLPDVIVTEERPLDASPNSNTSSNLSIRGVELSISKADTLPDLAAKVPGLTSYGSSPRNQGFNIRGVGNSQFNEGIDSGTGIYIDGIYLARQLYGTLSLYDLAGVTVLRGPQGATHGLDSTVGEIHILTEPPTFEPATYAAVSVGNYGYQRLEMNTTGTLVDNKVAGRLSLLGQKRDGLVTNVFDNSKINNQSRYALRGQLLLTPHSEFTAKLSAEYGLMDQQCCAVALLAPVSASIQASDDYMGYQRVGTNPFERKVDNNIITRNRLERISLSAMAEWAPTGRNKWISLTGLNSLRYSPSILDDGTSMRLLQGSIESESTQFTQEIRLVSQFNRAKTTLGALFLHQRLNGLETAVLGDEIGRWALGGTLRQQNPALNQQNSGLIIDTVLPPSALNGLTLNTPYLQTSNTLSAFASGDWSTSRQTTLTTGLRWTVSQRQAHISRNRTGGNLNSSPLSLTNGLQQLAGLLGQDLSSVTYDGIIDSLVGADFDRYDIRTDHGVSGKLALSHQLNGQTKAYASLARGYKSGGINLAGLTRQVKPKFEPEIADTLEIGLKKALMGGQLSYNLSLYRSRIKDFQALTHDEGEGLIRNPRPNNVLNIPRVDLQGLEADGSLKANRYLTLGAGLAYNRAISTDFANAPNEDTGQNNKDLSGKQLYNAPLWSGFTSLGLRIPMAHSQEVYSLFETRYRSGTFGAVDQSRSSYINAYAISNLRLGFRDLQKGWDLQMWVNNVFDKDYLAAVATLYSVGDYAGYAGDPRTYGITLGLTLDR